MSKKIMIIEDSLTSRLRLKMMLEAADDGLVIIECENAIKALEHSDLADCDLFAIDINMPEMDGLEFAGKLNEQGIKGWKVFISANVQDATKNKVKELGGEMFGKPVDKSAIDRIMALLGEAG